ncbi:MAG: hypothetical protein R3F34_10280 [Planctomycetota bacterium]
MHRAHLILLLALHIAVAEGVATAARAQVIEADQVLVAPDGADDYGFTVALDGDRLAVSSFDQGPVRLLERVPSGDFVVVHEIAAPATAPSDDWGYELEILGDLLAITATREKVDGAARGAVHLHRRSPDGSWPEVAVVRPSGLGENDRFGTAVRFDRDRMYVSADLPPRIDVFESAADDTWKQIASVPAGTWGSGRGVVVHGDRLLVGGGKSASLLERAGPEWNLVATFQSSSATGTPPNYGGDVDMEPDGSIVFLGDSSGGVVDVFVRRHRWDLHEDPDVGSGHDDDALRRRHSSMPRGDSSSDRPTNTGTKKSVMFVYDLFEGTGWLKSAELDLDDVPGQTIADKFRCSGDTAVAGFVAQALDRETSPCSASAICAMTPSGVSVPSGGEQKLMLRAPREQAELVRDARECLRDEPRPPLPGSDLVSRSSSTRTCRTTTPSEARTP